MCIHLHTHSISCDNPSHAEETRITCPDLWLADWEKVHMCKNRRHIEVLLANPCELCESEDKIVPWESASNVDSVEDRSWDRAEDFGSDGSSDWSGVRLPVYSDDEDDDPEEDEADLQTLAEIERYLASVAADDEASKQAQARSTTSISGGIHQLRPKDKVST